MAGRAQRGSRDRGRSSPPGSQLALAAASEVVPGAASITSMSSTTQAAPAAATPSPRAVWRLLQMKGMSPDEAANLTAFLYGLPTADLHWSMPQLNKILFLRSMRETGRLGSDDGGHDLPH